MDVNLNIKYCGVKLSNPFIVSQVPPNGKLEVIESQLEAGWGGVLLRYASLNAKPDKSTIASQRKRAPIYRGLDHEEKKMVDLGWIEPFEPIAVEEAEEAVRTLKEKFPDSGIIAGMVGNSREEWLKVSRRLSQAGADIIECDFSIPADPSVAGGPSIAEDQKLMEKATRYVRDGARGTPIMFKVPGTLKEKEVTVEILKESGADGIKVFYEPRGIPGINLTNFVPFPNVGAKSSLSLMGGAALKPYTLGVLAEWGRVAKGLDLSVLGGAYDWRDTVELMLVGARTIHYHGAVLQCGSGLVDNIRNGVSDYLNEKMISSLDKLVGKSLPYFVDEDKLTRGSTIVAAIDDKLCTRCGVCYRVCEGLGYSAINMSAQRKVTVDKKKCVGDGLCVAACPVFNCMSLRRISTRK